jgi:hypothetical protein
MVLIAYPSSLGNSTTFTKAMWEASPYNSPTVVELGEGWVAIGNSAFQSSAITSIEIPASVTSIGNNVFNLCANLTTVTFAAGSGLTAIGTYSFRQTAIASIIIPASVTSIGTNAFNQCASLTSVTFIASTGTTTGGVIGITIGDDAFHTTTVLASVFIKDGQVIKDSSATDITTTLSTTGAFFGSSASVVIRSYEIAGTGVFGGGNYTGAGSPPYTVLTNSDATGWTAIGGSAFDATALTSIIIPASVISIGVHAFNDCTSLTTVTFAAGSGLTAIGDYAFQQTALTSIIIPASVTSIGQYGFYGCADLTSVTFAADSQLATLGGTQIFTSSGLTTFTAPSPVLNLFGVSGGPNQTVSGKSGVTVNTLAPPPPPPAPICFPAGTPILTDQGEVDIDKIDPEKHTIRANKIEGITKTIGIEDYVVMIKKDAFTRNVPCRDTIISANHKIMFNNQMVQACKFVDKSEFSDKIYKVEYTGYTLYNVLLENKHDLMTVNNIIAETLSPTSVNAWLFRKMKSDISNVERKEAMDAYMKRVFPAPVLSCIMIGCK